MLEAVDIKTRGFVCAASIADFDEENVRIHFDGWSTSLSFFFLFLFLLSFLP